MENKMENKECTKCHIVKKLEKFAKANGKYKSFCKECKNKAEKERRSKIRDQLNEKSREKYRKKKEEVKDKPIDTNIKKICTICNIEKCGDSFYLNKTKGTIRAECKDCASLWRKDNYQKNREYVIKQTNQYKVNKMNTDIAFKFERRLRNRLYSAFVSKTEVKKQRTMKYVGCTPDFFKKWLEFQLYDGMTLENYGEIWHIDHCKPCYLFDFSIEEEVEKCSNWKNLRPYLAEKNLSKSNKYNPFDSVLQDIKSVEFLKIYGSEKHSV
jgi:hypothetical protein